MAAGLGNLFNRIGQLGVGLAIGGGVVQSALFNVDGGHRAVIFDRYMCFYYKKYIYYYTHAKFSCLLVIKTGFLTL